MEETSWRHKLREVWLKEGDRNTSFLHKMANAHRRNTLAKVKINGVSLTEEANIKVGIFQAFQILDKSKGLEPQYKGHELRSLSIQDATKLEEPFVKEAVFNALSALNGGKAPRLNGFSMAF